MGYTTSFNGEWTCTPPLTPEHRAYLEAFANTRRVKRNAAIAETLPDPVRIAAGLPIGHEGAYFVGGDGFRGQGDDASVTDGNNPPGGHPWPMTQGVDYNQWLATKARGVEIGLAQPGLWCQWVPNDNGTAITWDGGEKFYDYIEWIEYLIAHFLGPWGYKLNGEVEWEGESSGDLGLIRITDNKVEVGTGVITYDFGTSP